MSLENHQMQDILKEYDKIREKNRHILSKRQQEVELKAPLYFDYHKQIIALCMQRANSSLFPENNKTSDSEANYHKQLTKLRFAKEQTLLSAGFPANYLEPIYECPDCKDTGYLDTTQCNCLKQRIIKTLYSQSGIAHMLESNNFSTLSYEYYKDADLEAFTSAVHACKEMVENFSTDKTNLFFYGTVGCGKSFLSGCVAKALMDKGISVVYFSASQLFDILYQNSLYNGLEALYNYELIIVDDLGAEMTNSFVTTALFSLLNERILRKKATIISTNLSLSDMKERYSDRIVSRIIQNFKLCKLSGPDIRILKRLTTRK